MGNQISDPRKYAIPVSVALRPDDLDRISRHAPNISRSQFIRTAITNELAKTMDLDAESISFNSASFLNHHWFENGLYSMSDGGQFNSYMEWDRIVSHIQNSVSGFSLDLAINDIVPADIKDWLETYMKPLESQWRILSQEGQAAYITAALDVYRTLATKYDAS